MSIYQFVSCHTLSDDRRFYFCVHFDSLPFLWRWNSLPLNYLVLLSMVCFRLLFLSLHFVRVCVFVLLLFDVFLIIELQLIYYKLSLFIHFDRLSIAITLFAVCWLCCVCVCVCVNLRNECSTLWRYRISCDNIFCL